MAGWTLQERSAVSEQLVTGYLHKMGGYPKNVRNWRAFGLMWTHVCQTSNEVHESPPITFLKARCIPTMRQSQPYYHAQFSETGLIRERYN